MYVSFVIRFKGRLRVNVGLFVLSSEEHFTFVGGMFTISRECVFRREEKELCNNSTHCPQ